MFVCIFIYVCNKCECTLKYMYYKFIYVIHFKSTMYTEL